MTVAARPIQDGGQAALLSHLRLNRAACIRRRVRALGTNELSGGQDDDEDQSSLLQSFAHSSTSQNVLCALGSNVAISPPMGWPDPGPLPAAECDRCKDSPTATAFSSRGRRSAMAEYLW